MKAFGHGGSAIEHGDLSHHLGWIESLASDEEDNVRSQRGPKARRLERVMEAIQILTEVVEGEQ